MWFWQWTSGLTCLKVNISVSETVSCSHLAAFFRRSSSVKHFTSLTPSELTDFAAMNEYMTRIHMQNKSHFAPLLVITRRLRPSERLTTKENIANYKMWLYSLKMVQQLFLSRKIFMFSCFLFVFLFFYHSLLRSKREVNLNISIQIYFTWVLNLI